MTATTATRQRAVALRSTVALKRAMPVGIQLDVISRFDRDVLSTLVCGDA